MLSDACLVRTQDLADACALLPQLTLRLRNVAVEPGPARACMLVRSLMSLLSARLSHAQGSVTNSIQPQCQQAHYCKHMCAQAGINCISLRDGPGVVRPECVSAGADGSCIVWDMATCRRRTTLLANTCFKAVVHHPDGSQIITVGRPSPDHPSCRPSVPSRCQHRVLDTR